MVSLQGASILCWPACEVLCFDGGRRGFAQMLGGMVPKNIVIEAWLVFLNSSPCKPEGLVWGLRKKWLKPELKKILKVGDAAMRCKVSTCWWTGEGLPPPTLPPRTQSSLGPWARSQQLFRTDPHSPSDGRGSGEGWRGGASRNEAEVKLRVAVRAAWRWALRATLTWHWGKSLCCRTRLGARGLHRKPTQQHLPWQGETTVAKKHFQIEW